MGPMARKAKGNGARAKGASAKAGKRAKATARKKSAAGKHRAGWEAKAPFMKKHPAAKRSRRGKYYPEMKASRETFEAALPASGRPSIMQPWASPMRLAGLSLPRQMMAARKDSSMPHAATALAGAAAVAAVAGAAIFFIAGSEPIVAAGIVAPLFIAASIIIYSRLEGAGKK